MKAIMWTRKHTELTNSRRPVGGGVRFHWNCAAIPVNENATRTRVHTYSGRKVTHACVLADDNIISFQKTRVAGVAGGTVWDTEESTSAHNICCT